MHKLSFGPTATCHTQPTKLRHTAKHACQVGLIRHSCEKTYLVQDHTRVEHKVGVKERLELPHEVICLGAPFHLNKRSNIAPCTMLTLQKMVSMKTNTCEIPCIPACPETGLYPCISSNRLVDQATIQCKAGCSIPNYCIAKIQRSNG